jgi:hypothetical protein
MLAYMRLCPKLLMLLSHTVKPFGVLPGFIGRVYLFDYYHAQRIEQDKVTITWEQFTK